jgi:hypothetical protein
MYDAYPANVRKWIARHGGLSERLILLKGRELAAVVPACDAGPAIRTHPTTRDQVVITFGAPCSQAVRKCALSYKFWR